MINQNNVSFWVQDGTDYIRLDLYEQKPLVFHNKIQDFRDIKKVFTGKVFPFEVPYSKRNARIFKDWQKVGVVDSFDARRYARTRIEINGRNYDQGFLELIKIGYENGKPSKIEVAYVGGLASLPEQLGDDTLADLFPGWSFTRTDQNIGTILGSDGIVSTNIQIGEPDNVANDAIRYMLNSAGKRLVYEPTQDSAAQNLLFNDSEPSTRNLSRNTATANTDENSGLDGSIVKPWIKVNEILKGIENRYPPLAFDKDSTRSFFTSPIWTNMYMVMHSQERDENPDLQSQSIAFDVSAYNTGTVLYYNQNIEVRGFGTTFQVTDNDNSEEVRFSVTIIPNDAALDYSASFEIAGGLTVTSGDTNLPVGQGTRTFNLGFSGNGTFYINLESAPGFQYTGSTTISVSPGENPVANPSGQGPSAASSVELQMTPGTTPASSSFIVAQNMPNIKIIDWLSGIWKMLNLTAFYDTDEASETFGEIVTQTLDSFYDSGNTIDITSFVDPLSYEIERTDFYSDIQFQFADPVTLLGTTFENQSGRQYGEEKWDGVDSGDLGRKIHKPYDLSLPFQQFPYDNIPTTGITYPYIADEGGANVNIAPHFAYPVQTDITGGAEIAVVGTDAKLTTTYWRASKVYDLGGTDETVLTFYPEFDDYLANTNDPQQIVRNTLFQRFLVNYTAGVFSKESRVRKGKGYLPPNIIDQVKPNTIFQIGNDLWRQNTVKSELFTGRSDFELVSYFDINDTTVGRHGEVGVSAILMGPATGNPNVAALYTVNITGTETVPTTVKFYVDDVEQTEVDNTDLMFSYTPTINGIYEIYAIANVDGVDYTTQTITLVVSMASTSTSMSTSTSTSTVIPTSTSSVSTSMASTSSASTSMPCFGGTLFFDSIGLEDSSSPTPVNISVDTGQLNYTCANFGNSFDSVGTLEFDVTNNVDEWVSVEQLTDLALVQSSDGGNTYTNDVTSTVTLTPNLDGDRMTVTITGGNIPTVTADTDYYYQLQVTATNAGVYTHTINLSELVAHAHVPLAGIFKDSTKDGSRLGSITTNQAIARGEDGDTYEFYWRITADADYEFTGLGNANVLVSVGTGLATLTETFTAEYYEIRFAGTLGVENVAWTYEATGSAVADPATSFTATYTIDGGPSQTWVDGTSIAISPNGGNVTVRITPDGSYSVVLGSATGDALFSGVTPISVPSGDATTHTLPMNNFDGTEATSTQVLQVFPLGSSSPINRLTFRYTQEVSTSTSSASTSSASTSVATTSASTSVASTSIPTTSASTSVATTSFSTSSASTSIPTTSASTSVAPTSFSTSSAATTSASTSVPTTSASTSVATTSASTSVASTSVSTSVASTSFSTSTAACNNYSFSGSGGAYTNCSGSTSTAFSSGTYCAQNVFGGGWGSAGSTCT